MVINERNRRCFTCRTSSTPALFTNNNTQNNNIFVSVFSVHFFCEQTTTWVTETMRKVNNTRKSRKELYLFYFFPPITFKIHDNWFYYLWRLRYTGETKTHMLRSTFYTYEGSTGQITGGTSLFRLCLCQGLVSLSGWIFIQIHVASEKESTHILLSLTVRSCLLILLLCCSFTLALAHY